MIITFPQDYMPLLPLGEGWDEGSFNSLTPNPLPEGEGISVSL